MSESPFTYSERYEDDTMVYRHVIVDKKSGIPRTMAADMRKDKLYTEKEWRQLGIQMSSGWEHYMWHRPEKNVLLFRRPKADS